MLALIVAEVADTSLVPVDAAGFAVDAPAAAGWRCPLCAAVHQVGGDEWHFDGCRRQRARRVMEEARRAAMRGSL